MAEEYKDKELIVAMGSIRINTAFMQWRELQIFKETEQGAIEIGHVFVVGDERLYRWVHEKLNSHISK